MSLNPLTLFNERSDHAPQCGEGSNKNEQKRIKKAYLLIFEASLRLCGVVPSRSEPARSMIFNFALLTLQVPFSCHLERIFSVNTEWLLLDSVFILVAPVCL